MPIQQTKKQTDLEKRLKLLRQQVYGKGSEQLRTTQKTRQPEYQMARESDSLNHQSSDTPSHSESFRTDISYLYQDLLKIGLLATLAIGVQIILFIFTKNHILNLNFF